MTLRLCTSLGPSLGNSFGEPQGVQSMKRDIFFQFADSARQDHLCIAIRYVTKEAEIQASLIYVAHVKITTGAGLANYLCETQEHHGLNICNARGQGYDGCAAMSGTYRGVQAAIGKSSDKEYFVHCYAHRFNLVVVDMCCKITCSRNFFGVIEQLYTFMENSTKRHGLFCASQE
ncbi:UNVERIFIED_CONTAM: hypothetical protein FKN15_056892 [Acipenser sinensis]